MSPELGPLSGVGAATERVPNEGKHLYIVTPECVELLTRRVLSAGYKALAFNILKGVRAEVPLLLA
jgi:hypothetical protein